MNRGIFHIFRNTPLGRETLFQSMYFAQTLQIPLRVYIAQTTRFLMYFDQAVVQIDLDASYLRSPETARRHLDDLIKQTEVTAGMVVPRHFTGPDLPDIPPEFDYMSCPRCISHGSSRIGLGIIGPKVRMLVSRATFPVLITSPAFKPWRSLAVLCNGDSAQDGALDAAMYLKARSGLPLDYYRLGNGNGQDAPDPSVAAAFRQSHGLEMKSLAAALYDIPHDALVIISTGNQVLVKSLLFGSLLEKVQATLANNLLVVGPNVASSSVWPASVHSAHAPVDESPKRAAAWR